MKLTAYDPSVYGSLKGKVERISADAVVDEKERAAGEGRDLLPGDDPHR